MTDLLVEKIKVTAKESGIEGRVVIVASDSYKHPYREGIRFDKINEESGYCFLTQSIFFCHFHHFQDVLSFCQFKILKFYFNSLKIKNEAFVLEHCSKM